MQCPILGVKLGEQETKLLKAEEELVSLKDSYDEAMRRVRLLKDGILALPVSDLRYLAPTGG